MTTRLTLRQRVSDRLRDLVTGTATGGTTTTVVDTARIEPNDYWNGKIVTFTAGTHAGVSRTVTDFVQSTATMTISPAVTGVVDTTDVYEIHWKLTPSQYNEAINAAIRRAYGIMTTRKIDETLRGGLTTVLADTFERANSATALGTADFNGVAWTANAGTWGISGNEAYCVTAANLNNATLDAKVADDVRITAGIVLRSSGDIPGIVFRYQDVNNWVRVQLSLNTLTLAKNVAGTPTTVESDTIATVYHHWYDLEVRLDGTTVTVYLDDTLQMTATIAELTTQTKFGLWNGGSGTTARWRNFGVRQVQEWWDHALPAAVAAGQLYEVWSRTPDVVPAHDIEMPRLFWDVTDDNGTKRLVLHNEMIPTDERVVSLHWLAYTSEMTADTDTVDAHFEEYVMAYARAECHDILSARQDVDPNEHMRQKLLWFDKAEQLLAAATPQQPSGKLIRGDDYFGGRAIRPSLYQ